MRRNAALLLLLVQLRCAATFLLGGRRSIIFSELDAQRVSSSLQAIVAKANRWRDAEWRVLKAPPTAFSTRTSDGGVTLVYFQTSEAGRLTEEGTCDIALQGKGVVFSPRGRTRPQNEDVLYRLLLHEIRDGALQECCTLAWPAAILQPPSAGVAKLVAKLDAACLVDKKGQYRRF